MRTRCPCVSRLACSAGPDPRAPGFERVVLITIDTLRADHLGAYGHGGIKTPNLDDLAAEGIRFERAYTPCPITLPAHVSLMTATYPMFHDVRNNGIATARPSLTTLAEVRRLVDCWPLSNRD